MNKDRRAQLAKAVALLAEARTIIEEVKDGEQEAFDNMPENMQGGEKGDAMLEYITVMEDVASGVEEAENTLTEIAEG